jgi:acetylglutamate kinase
MMKEHTIPCRDPTAGLIQALPYIQRHHGKTIVVKYGGNAMISQELKTAVVQDILFMASAGLRVVLVHGGGPEIEKALAALGKESRFVRGLRYTDEETMEIVQMVLCGKVNKDIVSLIQQHGGRALGLCGIDGGMLGARRVQSDGEDLGFVGDIKQVDTGIVETIVKSGAVPVISSVALGIEEDAGIPLNINADSAAGNIAAGMKAEKLILMTDVQGVLRDVNDPASLIKVLRRSELEAMKKEGRVSKGMIPKIDCCAAALDGGVREVRIIDGRLPHGLLIELFTGQGTGTALIEG